MKKILFLFLFFTVNSLTANIVHKITIDGAINPVATEFIIQSIEEAEDANAELLVIELDTPGGLMASMHKIVKSILASEVPVAVYVSPSGSRAGSAGVFITMAAHIAAMAPSTNIGSAHPVNMQGESDSSSVMTEKIVNDAVASIRSVAESVQHTVQFHVEKALGLPVQAVNVYIQGLRLEKEKEKEKVKSSKKEA